MLVVGVKQPFDSTKPYKKPGLNNQETGVLVSVAPNADGSARLAVRSHITGRTCTIDSALAHPGFALTFHRCQGQTFDCRLGVSASKIFDPSMAYVAMSRVRTKDQLRIISLPPSWR
jgi:ATP-dependent exoDNAse (exonuclease V) alpha subunit